MLGCRAYTCRVRITRKTFTRGDRAWLFTAYYDMFTEQAVYLIRCRYSALTVDITAFVHDVEPGTGSCYIRLPNMPCNPEFTHKYKAK
jgi:hypothetical protein